MTQEPCPSHYQWDLYHTENLSEAERQAMEHHCLHCHPCTVRRKEREFEMQAVHKSPRFQHLLRTGKIVLAQHEEARDASADWWEEMLRSWWLPALTTTMLLIVLLPSWLNRTAPNQAPSLLPERTSKGVATPQPRPSPLQSPTIQLMIYKQGQSHSRVAYKQQRLNPGDLIQFSYTLPKAVHLMIVSINERGDISKFVPLDQQGSVRRQAGQGELPNAQDSLELDDYIGMERLFVVYRQKPFDFSMLKSVVAQAFQKAGKDLKDLKELPKPWHHQNFLIHKTKTPVLP